MNTPKPFFIRIANSKFWLIVGLALSIIGQSLLIEPQPLQSTNSITNFLEQLNKTFYLTLKNPVPVLVGLFCIALALVIFSRFFTMPSTVEKQQFVSGASWKNHRPWLFAGLAIYALVMIPLAFHRYSTPLVLGWLVSILAFTFWFWKNETPRQAVADLSLTSRDVVWMLTLAAFAIITGSYLLNDLPAGWIADEGPFWKMARDIALGEENLPFFDFGVFTFPASSSILQSWIMRWAGINMWGWRFASVLPAALTVFPLYLLAHELFNRQVAIAANVMMIVNPYFLAFERLGYNNSQSLFPVTLCIYLLTLGLRKNSRFHLWLAGLAAGLGFYTYFSAWLGVVVIIIIIMGHMLISRIKLKTSAIRTAIVIAGTLSIFLPRIVYGMSDGDSAVSLYYKFWETGPINTFYGNFVFGNELISQTTIFTLGEVEVFYDLKLYGILFVRGIVRTAAILFDPIGYNDHQIFYGLIGPGTSLLFVLGLGVILAKFKNLQYFVPLIWFLAGFFLLGVTASIPPRPTHMVAIIPALSFISAIGLSSLLNAFANEESDQSEKSQQIRKLVTGGILTIISVLGLFHYFFMIPYVYSPSNQDDYISWLRRQLPASTNLFLIDHYAVTRNPLDESLHKMPGAQVMLLTSAELEANPDQIKTWKNFIAFIGSPSSRKYAEWLASQIDGASVQMAYVPGQRRRGFVVTDMLIRTNLDISPQHGITDLWNSPARIFLLLFGTGIVILLSSSKRQKTKDGIK